jgi:haloalkane dehalogenase
MDYVRTPDHRFDDLAGYDFEPHYVELSCGLRMHCIDEGSGSGEVVLLLHGQPTWSYLYRFMVRQLSALGHRVLAPDFFGFGRSDKPALRSAHTIRHHIGWLTELLVELDLHRITLVAQDWGGPIGLGALAAAPDRFSRIVAANTTMHTADPSLKGRLGWACHGTGDGRVCVEAALLDYQRMTQELPELQPSLFVQGATTRDLSPEELAAYDAPFPDERFCAGPRQLPLLMGLTPSSECARRNTKTLGSLGTFSGSLLTAYSDGDPSTQGWDAVIQEACAGARFHHQITLDGAGHFLQEDVGPALADAIMQFMEATPSG